MINRNYIAMYTMKFRAHTLRNRSNEHTTTTQEKTKVAIRETWRKNASFWAQMKTVIQNRAAWK